MVPCPALWLAMIFVLFNSKSRLRVGGALVLLRRESSRRRVFPTGRAPARVAVAGARIPGGMTARSSSSSPDPVAAVELRIPTSQDMEDVGGLLFSTLLEEGREEAGEREVGGGFGGGAVVICLDGDLGAGKTALSRGFVRAATGDAGLRVTSPTYLLSNAYQTSHHEIHHIDLYRLTASDDLLPLNLAHVFSRCVSLIEWPRRLGDRLPGDRLDVQITILPAPSAVAEEEGEVVGGEFSADGPDDLPRRVVLRPFGERWKDRMRRLIEDGSMEDLIV